MSYARFSDNSDVYVFLSVSGSLECCACCLVDEGYFLADTTDGMLEHLQAHVAAGHDVPNDCIEGLEIDRVSNEKFIRALNH